LPPPPPSEVKKDWYLSIKRGERAKGVAEVPVSWECVDRRGNMPNRFKTSPAEGLSYFIGAPRINFNEGPVHIVQYWFDERLSGRHPDDPGREVVFCPPLLSRNLPATPLAKFPVRYRDFLSLNKFFYDAI
jgi:hypothetical protein